MFVPTGQVLCALSMDGRSFREQVAAAASTGFDAITVIYPAYQRALRQEGLTAREMRALLDDSGIVVDELEVLHEWSFADRPADGANPCGCGLCPDRDDVLEMAEALNARTIIASQRTDPMPVERLAEQLADVSDALAKEGLRIAIEFIPYSSLHTVAQVNELLEVAGRPNAGIFFDANHHLSVGGSDDMLAAVRPERIFTVRFSDGVRFPPTMSRDEIRDTMFGSGYGYLPGEGELDLLPTLRTLDRMDVRAPFGVEVRKAEWADRPAAEVAQTLRSSADELLAAL